ncbi:MULTISPECIES: adenylosuccinate lyase [unclassified Bdellovibrio]|uniref:adenylosuccinate lyase n=1 Tax=unclassified Bdellovibrio TaxID=2633795 RepID=UPI00115B859B|nr:MULTISPECIES: adenylosuccinate lyase [unclassified Bdellovibrio]QDK45568.1 adenylosuccinate lyase [Bdellovibrio sp. ZAP7]QLY23815.1 adenylosuccinate lyase [Bdellovibrio sp. KM01]
MIERYTRPEMGLIWDADQRFGKMMQVEITVAQVQAQLGLIPKVAAKAIAQKARFSVKRISEIEKETKHDVIAFVSNVAENVGPHGKYIHFGMTSSDVLDTAFSLQVREAGQVLMGSILRMEKSLQTLVSKHAETMCAGRTHGMFAEPTTFGFKMAGFLTELRRNKKRVKDALENMNICKLSGAVGTFSSQSPKVEAMVARKLGLKPEPIATQVIPRDRHAEMMLSLAMIGTGLERLAVELRHLQRSDVGEVTEGFTKGQKGSSAMPHKKNPISAENITGLSRLLRGYAVAAMEDVALWHERDISHSSVERVIFPDAFIVADYAIHRMSILLDGLEVNKKRMLDNIESSQGQLFSSHVLLALVAKGMRREDAYALVQRLCHTLGYGEHLKDKLMGSDEARELLKPKEIEEIFAGKKHKKSIKDIIKRVKV